MTELQQRIAETIAGMEAVTADVRQTFGGMSVAQLNQKPGERRWSAAQCLEHLILSSEEYFPKLEQIIAGTYDAGLWAKISPFSGFLGSMLIKSLDPANARKVKTSANMRPSREEIGADIVERFARNQEQVAAYLKRLPPTTNLRQLKVVSPFAAVVTYSVDDMLRILVVHEQRHLVQAKRAAGVAGA